MFKFDRTAFAIQTFEEADSRIHYWRTRPVAERMAAMVEMTRQAFRIPHGVDVPLDRSHFRIKARNMQLFLSQDLRDFITALNRANVRYLLVGGYAVNVHGYQRSTGDVDVWVEPTEINYGRLTQAFGRFGLPIEVLPLAKFLAVAQYDVFSFGRPPNAIDLMTKVRGLVFGDAYANSTLYEFAELPVRVIGLADLITAKRAAGRPRDLADLVQLEKVAEEE